MLKKLTRKQIIIIVSSLVAITGVIVGAVFLLNRGTEEEIKKCLVEFETNGGTSIESQEIECGHTIKKPNVKPEKVGFEFIGWYLNDSEFDFSKKIDKNIILIANYNKTTEEELITVTFDSNGGTEVKSIELVKGTTITEPVKPTRNGYTFEGWYYLNEEKFDFSKEINENITLIARWKENKNNQSQGGNAGNSQKPNGGSSGNQGGNTGENNNSSNPGGNEEKPQPKPDEKDKYTYVVDARIIDTCFNSNYQPYDGYCYLSVNREFIKNGCKGREIDGKCYMIEPSDIKYLCNGEDKYDNWGQLLSTKSI